MHDFKPSVFIDCAAPPIDKLQTHGRIRKLLRKFLNQLLFLRSKIFNTKFHIQGFIPLLNNVEVALDQELASEAPFDVSRSETEIDVSGRLDLTPNAELPVASQ